MECFVGIDVSKATLDIASLPDAETWVVTNDDVGLTELVPRLAALHPTLVESLPHQITAVYEAMLPRQPLRFLLADAPGAGKTIMAGLLIKEEFEPRGRDVPSRFSRLAASAAPNSC